MFLADYPVVWADEGILMRYAEIFGALGKKVRGPDPTIRGSELAVARDLPLLTPNVGELSRIERIRIAWKPPSTRPHRLGAYGQGG